MTLNDIDDAPLRFLSLAPHPFLDGSISVHGTLTLAGVGEVVDITLEVIDDDVVIVTGTLTELTRALLLLPFPDAGTLSVASSQPLFVFSPEQLAGLDTSRSENSALALRVRARASDGRETVADAGQVQQLVRYTRDNRYFIGEELQGGNDWVLPSVRAMLERFEGVQFGDISNLHGGSFPPHVSHQQGRDADVWFPGYNELDAAAATTLLAIIDNPAYVGRIELIFVAYERVDGDPFWSVLEGYVLSDGRPAGAVIQPEPEHTGHFHVRFFG